MNGTPGVEAARVGLTDDAQYLTFTLANEEYGVEILRVQEIRGYTAPTPVPNTPTWVKGVMNLRGTVVPVFDVRLKFGMEPSEYDRFTVIVVVNVGTRVVGLIVDAVSDVLDIPADSIQPAPDMGGAIDTSMLQGLARNGDRLTLLLDADRFVGMDANVTRNAADAA